ncbi:MAG: head decoration protein [Methylococcales bacterium]|nr:head decoration protein [Methylococcales bacterium]
MSIPGTAEGFNDKGSVTPENLIAGEYPRVSRIFTVTGGAVLPIGSVLGRIDVDGRYLLSAADAVDGSQVPDIILGETVDTTNGDKQAVGYFTGEFNELALNVGTGHTLESSRSVFRTRGLFLRQNQPV